MIENPRVGGSIPPPGTIFLEKEINFQALAANGFSSTLAKNAGTSVDQLERFYLKNMASTKELIENLQTRGDD
ncbi:hypothetical protein [Leisingera sp. ANG-M7]|uniref:hypothetical protein n=1 Tax=Leisingera sp. ANG-M7 TaxID=1577902 RepID=UPI00057D20AB|nr:hypothetical protein [Leisingera sp. ANG-M7]KIC35733.1 hypothetical protein RA26_15645 [Leisingera sp. ANG-M7]